MQLEPTGERMIMEHYKSTPEDFVIYLMHVATYRFAEQFTQGKRVLDYGCGSGYGSAQIARGAARVTAVDVCEDAVAHARAHFGAGNIDFSAIDPARPLPFPDASFDTVLSFQVFEHVEDTDRYLAEIRRVLVPGGTLLLVTPDRSTRLLPGQRPWNRWHVREYDNAGLSRLLARHFATVGVQGMGGDPEVIGIELRRCNRLKWMTLPFTLPVMPDRWRVAALNAIHKLHGKSAHRGTPREFPFGIESVRIAPGIAPSVNLVAIAR